MIQHIVLLKWKPSTTDADITEAFKAAHELLDGIDAVQNVTLGRNRAKSDHGFTHALIVSLSDEDALESYLHHRIRARYHDTWLGPLEEQRIEIDVPVDMAIRRAPSVRDWTWGASVGMGPPLD